MPEQRSHLFPVRLLLGAAVVAALLIVLFLVLLLTDTALSVWQRLHALHPWVAWGYLGLLVGLSLLLSWTVWRLLRPRARASETAAPVPDEAQLRERMERAEQSGVFVADARGEMEELARRRSVGTVHVALFGEISSGKSSLIQALLPEAEVAIDPRGGTTRAIAHYTWVSPAGDRLVLTDLPGLNEAGGGLDALAREEALRAHAVVFVCEGDLTRDQLAALKPLLALGKPLIVAVNKVDRYGTEDLAQIEARLRSYLQAAASAEVVPVSAGGTEEIIRVGPDGNEQRVLRPRPARVEPLREAIQRCIDADARTLDQLRDAAVFVLTQQKLDQALAGHRRTRAEELVKSYTRRAVVGALAAVAPGMDVAIQGYLGLRFMQELCALYEVSVREIDLERFLKSAGSLSGKTLPLLLAVAGNAFKAFPGMGTLAGGLMHAIAYGLIFDSLGRAVARTLESRGSFAPAPALRLLEDNLRGDLEARARRIAQMALEARKAEQRTGEPTP